MAANGKPIALKEWAVAVNALREGKQILIMRKGGIVEETRDFQVESHHFYLYPTYEHQKKDLMKDGYKEEIHRTMVGWTPEDTTVVLTTYAEVAEDIEVFDQEELNKLGELHIWTDQFAEERLKWKKKNPLHVLLLRVYELEKPVEIKIEPEYLGCKSWVEIAAPLPEVGRKPVLSDEAFAEKVQAVKEALGKIKAG
ncbi:DUF1802 family protein [Gorillibacterium sp. sgz5001074]|uniref:DUF1802 family protein n=1 Tax=Gorillibacterium sp. sgz5001074 TaxID=3446695 RepID=UPI003F666147